MVLLVRGVGWRGAGCVCVVTPFLFLRRDGLYSLAGIQAGAASGKLLSSWNYFDPSVVPTPGDERRFASLSLSRQVPFLIVRVTLPCANLDAHYSPP